MEKRLIVGFQSAVDYWRATRAASPDKDELEFGGKVIGAQQLTSAGQVARAMNLCCTAVPLDVVCSARSDRRNNSLVVNHMWKGPLSRGRTLALGNGIEVCKMPAVFSQLAMTLDEISLAQLANEMAGNYVIDLDEEEGMVGDLEPLVDLAELKGYAESARALKIRGASRACRALELATPNSNSPRESDIAVFMMQTRACGGIGLRGFKMNVAVRLPDALAEKVGQKIVIPDFSWPNGTIVEYDSKQEHLSPEARAHDELKRRAYQAVGMDCLTLTNGILRRNNEVELFFSELERSLGLHRRPPSEQMQESRKLLRKRLFGKEAKAVEERAGAFPRWRDVQNRRSCHKRSPCCAKSSLVPHRLRGLRLF